MRVFKSAILLAVLAVPLSATRAEKPPLSLPKVGKWEVNYDVDSCHLLARFGAGANETVLSITQTSPSDMFRVELFNPALASKDILVPVKISFDPQAAPITRMGLTMTTGKTKMPLVMLEDLRIDGVDSHKAANLPLPQISPDRPAQVKSITFKFPNVKAYRLETGSMAVPMQALRTCTDDLVVSWGFDPAVQAALFRRPIPASNPGNWLHDEDFPAKAAWAGHNGLIQFRLDVDTAGGVANCRVLFRTDPDDFADQSCKVLIQRAKFSPALDAKGQPVKSFYIGRIRFQAGGEW